ncbi:MULTISPECIES: hypothetical protein [Clostridium]|uniref:hypothetical protein n=1 Tax=Clostridium TaxID=1485 RepID=UPI001EF2E96D|nr:MULTISPECIES: hypothetical protein [Clostridium]
MLERVDEKILDFLNQMERREEIRNICNGNPIKIGNRYYEFEEKCFFDNKLKIYIPKDFEEMPLETRKLKYPSENEPDIIKCDEKGNICITLKIIDRILDENKVEELKDGMKEGMKNTNPIDVFYEDGVLKVDSQNIGFIEFKSYTMDGPIFNLMFFLELDEKTLMGNFRCLYAEYGEWRETVFQVIRNIRVMKENEEAKANE